MRKGFRRHSMHVGDSFESFRDQHHSELYTAAFCLIEKDVPLLLLIDWQQFQCFHEWCML